MLTVVSQWSELRELGVAFDLVWLIPGVAAMLLYYILNAATWGLILRLLGHPVDPAEAQRIWAQPLLVRYIPGSVLFVLARVLLAEKVGVSRRVSTAGIVYEQAAAISAALSIATWFVIDHPDTQDLWVRWLPILIIPLMVACLHPRVFGPVTTKILIALGRQPLPQMISFGGVLTIYAAISASGRSWASVSSSPPARSTIGWPGRFPDHRRRPDDRLSRRRHLGGHPGRPRSKGRRFRLGGQGRRCRVADFGVGAAIAIAVRATQTVVELIYVGAVTWLARRQRRLDESLGELVAEAEAAEAAPRS